MCQTCSETTLLVFPRGGSFVASSVELDQISPRGSLTQQICNNQQLNLRHMTSIKQTVISYKQPLKIHSLTKTQNCFTNLFTNDMKKRGWGEHFHIHQNLTITLRGEWWPGGRALASNSRGPGFDPHTRCRVVSLNKTHQLSRLVGKPTTWFPNRSDTNRPVQAQKRARSLKFRI